MMVPLHRIAHGQLGRIGLLLAGLTLAITLVWPAGPVGFAPASAAENTPVIQTSTRWQYSYAGVRPACFPTGDCSSAANAPAAWQDNKAQPIGFGVAGMATTLTPAPGTRPLTAYFRTTYAAVSSASVVRFTVAADDGWALWVNGEMVKSHNMDPARSGAVPWRENDYAETAVNALKARQSPITVDVPAAKLAAAGSIGLEVHGNYYKTPNLAMEVTAVALGVDTPQPPPEPSGLIDYGSQWTYTYPSAAMPSGWQSGNFAGMPVAVGKAPIGFGTGGLNTTLTRKADSDPSRAFYVKSSLRYDPATMNGLTITTYGDDGIVVYLGGQRVGSKNIPDGPTAFNSYATSAIRTAQAKADPLVISIPASQLAPVATTYPVVAEIHLNYRATPDVSFDLVVQPGAAPTPIEPTGKTLTPFALTNAFGADAASSRVFTWQTTSSLTRPTVDVVPAGQSFASASVRRFTGSSARMDQVFTSYNAARVQVAGLSPGTSYSYRVGNIAADGAQWYSPTYRFATAPATVGTFTFLDFADSQGSANSYGTYWGNTLNAGLNRVPDAPFIIHTGDMIDAVNWPHLENWFNASGTRLSGPAFYPVLGNHEGDFTQYNTMWQQMFAPTSEAGIPLMYSFTYGNALFLNLNTNFTSSADLNKQAAWVAQTAAAKGSGKFIVAAFHKAPYGGIHASGSDVQAVKNILVPALERAGVDLVLQGHDHNYIRTYPIKNGVPDRTKAGSTVSASRDGIVFLMPRNSGEKSYDLASTANRPWINVQWNPGSLANSPSGTVYSAITVSSSSMTVRSYTTGGQLIDTFTVTP